MAKISRKQLLDGLKEFLPSNAIERQQRERLLFLLSQIDPEKDKKAEQKVSYAVESILGKKLAPVKKSQLKNDEIPSITFLCLQAKARKKTIEPLLEIEQHIHDLRMLSKQSPENWPEQSELLDFPALQKKLREKRFEALKAYIEIYPTCKEYFYEGTGLIEKLNMDLEEDLTNLYQAHTELFEKDLRADYIAKSHKKRADDGLGNVLPPHEQHENATHDENELDIKNIQWMFKANNTFGFVDELVDEADMENDLPEKHESEFASLQQEQSQKAVYKTVKFTDKDQVIRSAKVYNEKQIGLLKQTSTGKVTNLSTNNLTDKQQAEVALKQVTMLLRQYHTTHGKIILTGHDKVFAQKVYAGLLLASKIDLIQSKNIDIRISGLKSRFKTKSSFIKKHLGNYLSREEMLEELALPSDSQSELKKHLKQVKGHEPDDFSQMDDSDLPNSPKPD